MSGLDKAAEGARKLRFMAFDVDGVLTDGKLYFGDNGEEMKAFNTLDGQGLKLMQRDGIELAFISARRAQLVALRAANLGIDRVEQGVEDKLACFDRMRAEMGLERDQCGYMGDDLPDLRILVRCGFAATVPNAPDAIRSRVHYVTRVGGGDGAVREIAEFVLKARGSLDRLVEGYL
jgi:3-deoxy-D-manno-octulosonate 8-phosphate phosphatase (KDO 8-P phosphatase)